MSTSDAHMELEQQHLLIEQLKALVRERDDTLQKKEKELQETTAKLSKARLQAKAKAVKKASQAQDGKKDAEEQQKESSFDGASHDDGSMSQQAGRAKMMLFKRKLEEKDNVIAEKEDVIRMKEGQLEAKERVLAERDSIVHDLTEQLEEKTKIMERLQGMSGSLGDEQGQIHEMYAQMVYKDRKIMELNTKILEQDKRVMDLQEFAGEKDQVIRGRNKVVEILQNSIKEKDQAVQGQALLISKLTARVESTNEKVDEVTEQLRHREQELKSETERFHIKLTESQKYFEEMLKEVDDETKRLRAVIEQKDKELTVRENDLVELISKHERDIEILMKKENVNLQDHALQMLENKLKDTNGVLDGKVKVISILQKENAEKEHELLEGRETMRMFKEKLQVMSEQMMLQQATFADNEAQWKEEKHRFESRIKETADKHETELSEKDLQLQTLQSTLYQYEAAYNQALEQYNRLQEHYQQAVAGHLHQEQVKQVTSSNEGQHAEIDHYKKELEDSKKTIEQLSKQVKELESSSKATVPVDEGSSKGETRMLKMKAQMTSKMKALEKELQELKEASQTAKEAMSLKQKIAELEDANRNLQTKLVDLDDSKATVAELRAQIDELQIVVDTVHDQKAELQKQLAAMNDDRLNLSQQDQSDKLTSLVSEAENLHAQLEQAVTRIAELEGSNIEFTEKIARIQEQKDAFEKENIHLHQETETWREKDELVKLSNLALEKEQEDLQAKISELTSSLLGEQTITKQQKEEINQLLSKLSDLEDQNKEILLRLEEAKDGLRQAEQQKVAMSEELESATEKVSSLQEQVNLLKEENLQLEEQTTTLKSNLTTIQSELDATNTQLEALKDELGGDIDKLRTKSERLVHELSEKSFSLEEAVSELATASDQIRVLKSSLEESTTRSKELELQVKQLTREIDVSKEGQNEQGKEFSDKIQMLLTQLTELESELVVQQRLSSEQQGHVSELSTSLECKEKELKSVCESLEVIKESFLKIQLELSDKESELKATLDSLESEKKTKSTLEEHLANISIELNSFREALAEKEESIKCVEDEKNSCIELINAALASVKSELESSSEKNSELHLLLDNKDSELVVGKQNCYQLQKQVETLSHELESTTSKVTELQTVNEALQEQLANYQEQFSTKSVSFEENSQRNQQLIESLQEKKESSDQLIASLEQQLASLKNELEETGRASADKDSHISILNEAVSDLEKQHDSLQAAVQKLQTEKSQLDQQMLEMTQSLEEAQRQAQAYAIEAEKAHEQAQAYEDARQGDEARLLELTNAVNSAESRMREMEESSKLSEESLRLEVSSLQSQLSMVDEQVRAEQQLKLSLDGQLSEVQSLLKEEQKSKSILENSLSERVDEKATLESKIYCLESTILENDESAARTSQDYEVLITELRDKVVVGDSQIVELRHSLESVTAQSDISSKIVEQLQTSSSEKEQNIIQQLRDKTDEVVSLQQQLEHASNKIMELESAIAKTEGRIGEFQEQLQASFSEKEQNIQQLNDKTDEVVSLQQQLEHASNEIMELKAAITKNEGRISEFQEQLTSNKDDFENLTSVIESLQKELETRNAEFLDQRISFDEERTSSNVNIEALRKRISDLEIQTEELAEVKQKWSAAEEERQNLVDHNAVLQTDVETAALLRSRVTDLESQVEVLTGNVHAHLEELAAVQAKCSCLEACNSALSSKVDDLTDLRHSFEMNVSTLSREKETLEEQLKGLSEKFSSIGDNDNELFSIEKALSDAEQQLQLKESEYHELREVMEERIAHLSQQISHLQERSQQVDTLTIARDKLLQEVESMSTTVAEKDHKISSLLENMQEMEDRLVQVEELSNQQASSEQQHNQLTSTTGESSEIEALKASLADKEKARADKELMAKKAIATAKKLKFQLNMANKSLEEAQTQIVELNVEKESLQARMSVINSEILQLPSITTIKEPTYEEHHSESQPPTESSTVDLKSEDFQAKPETTSLDTDIGSSHTPPLDTSLNLSGILNLGDTSLEIESLQAQLSTYRECCDQLQQQVQNLTEVSFTTESKLKQKQNLIDQLEGVKEGLKMTVSEVESAYQQLQVEFENAREEFLASKEAGEKKCEILTEQAQQWKSFFDSLQQEVTAKDHRLQQMEAELYHIHSEHSESIHLKKIIEEKDESIAECRVHLESLQSDLQTKSEATEEMRKQLTQAEETIEQINVSLEEKEQAVIEHALLLGQLQGHVHEREETIEGLKESLRQQNADFEAEEQRLHLQITGLDRQIEDYKNKVVDTTAVLDNMQQAKEAMAAQNESLKQQLEQQGAYISELNEIMDALKAQVESSRITLQNENAEELESLRSALSDFQQQVEDQRLIISMMEQSMNQQVGAEKEDEIDHKSQIESSEDLNMKLMSYQTMIEELNMEILSLKEEKVHIAEESTTTETEFWKESLDNVTLEKVSLEEERNHLRFELDGQLEISRRMQEVVSEKLSQVQNLQTTYENLQSNLVALSSEKEQLLVLVDSLKGEIEGMEQIIAESQFSQSKSKDEVNQLKTQKEQLTEKVEHLEQELLELQQQQLRSADGPVSELRNSKSENSLQWSHQKTMETPIIVAENLQRSAVQGPSSSLQQLFTEQSIKLKETEDILKQVQSQYEKNKSRLQVAEVKCEKMLLKLKTFKDKNDKLQIQVDELQQQLGLREGSPKRDGNLREDRRRLEEQVAFLNNRLRDVETHNGKLIHDNSTLKEQMKNLEATLLDQAKLHQVTEQLSRVQSELEVRNVALASSTSLAEELQKTVEGLREELQLKLVEVNDLKCELVQKAQSSDSLFNGRLDDLQKIVNEKTEAMIGFQRKLDLEVELNTELNAAVARLQFELEKSRTDAETLLVFELSKLRDEKNEEVIGLQDELANNSNKSEILVRERDVEIVSVKEELKLMENEIMGLNKKLLDERVRADKAENEVSELKRKLSDELNLRNEYVKEKELNKSELNSVVSQLETVRVQFDSLSQDNADYQNLMTTLTRNNSGLTREVEELRFKLKKVDELHQGKTMNELPQGKAMDELPQGKAMDELPQGKAMDEHDGNDVSDLAQRLEEAERDREELTEEFEGVREELVFLRREKMALIQQVGDLTNTVYQLNDRMTNLQPLSVGDNSSEGTTALDPRLSLGKDKHNASLEQIEALEEELTDLRDELATALNENQQFKNEVNGLNWKLEEASSLEQELEDLQSQLSSSTMEKKILSHDLEEVRGEMSALQTDKHLLMKEVERLSELLEDKESHDESSVDNKTLKTHQTSSEELQQLLAAKDSEINEIQDIIIARTDQLTAAVKEISGKDKVIIDRDQEILTLKEELIQLDNVLKDNEDMDQKIYVLTEELKVSNEENESLKRKFDNFNQKIDSVKSLEADFESLSTDFNTVLEEKSSLVREIDELHVKIRDLTSRQYEATFSVEQQHHVMREKETLQRRVEQLEGTEGSVMEENARLTRELDRISALLQQVEFDNESLTSQLQLTRNGEASESKFQEEHKRVQVQFVEVLEQKNGAVKQLNEALHSLKQREARCQQLAMQVSQLAEDRGYLNTQLANISKSLREKEQEWLAMRQQFGDLYQAYIGTQAKNAELERRIALDSVQKELEDEETAAEADQIRGDSDQTVKRLEELQSAYQGLQDTNTALSSTLTRERTLREQLERELGEAQEQIKLLAAVNTQEVHIELEDDNDVRIRETSTMLTRHGLGYCSRVHSWLKVKNRQLSRVMRLRPGLRTVIWVYFVFLHIMLIACFGGFL